MSIWAQSLIFGHWAKKLYICMWIPYVMMSWIYCKMFVKKCDDAQFLTIHYSVKKKWALRCWPQSINCKNHHSHYKIRFFKTTNVKTVSMFLYLDIELINFYYELLKFFIFVLVWGILYKKWFTVMKSYELSL